MKYLLDHDLHIHSQLSLCSSDPEQNTNALLEYAEKNHFTDICLTDHFWDETVPGANDWYKQQGFEHIKAALPLPQSDKVRFHFGCETDMEKDLTLGLARENFDLFEFVIIPTTHLHMMCDKEKTVPERAEIYVERLEKLLDMDLPFEKVGIAHLTCPLIAMGQFEDHIDLIDLISDDCFKKMFDRIAQKGAGFELNFPVLKYNEGQLERILRPYRIAKQCGCKFYFGSDGHHPDKLQAAPEMFARTVELLGLEESDKFRPFK